MNLLSTLHDHTKRLDALAPMSRVIVQVVDSDGVVQLENGTPAKSDQLIRIFAGKGYMPSMDSFHKPGLNK